MYHKEINNKKKCQLSKFIIQAIDKGIAISPIRFVKMVNTPAL